MNINFRYQMSVSTLNMGETYQVYMILYMVHILDHDPPS
jgi:hypothetical protein